jgi:putative transposase
MGGFIRSCIKVLVFLYPEVKRARRSRIRACVWDSRCELGRRRTRSGRWTSCTMRAECGRAIRVLSVMDAYTRECLALEVDTSFASRRGTRVLDAIVAERR